MLQRFTLVSGAAVLAAGLLTSPGVTGASATTPAQAGAVGATSLVATIRRDGVGPETSARTLGRAGDLPGSLVFIRDFNVWIAAPDGSGARPLTGDGTSRWPYRTPSEDDAGHIYAIAGGAQQDATFVRLDQQGRILARFSPAIQSLSILFGQIAPDGSSLVYGALFGDSDCGDYSDCYTFFDHTIHYNSSTAAQTVPGSTEASDVQWATWAGNGRVILQTDQLDRVDYHSPSMSDKQTWFTACDSAAPGCDNTSYLHYQPTVNRVGNAYASSLVVQPWSGDQTAYLLALPASAATTASPPSPPGDGCVIAGPAPTDYFPMTTQLTIQSPSWAPDGRPVVAYSVLDATGSSVWMASFPDFADCGSAGSVRVLTDAGQAFWSPAALAAPALRFVAKRPRVSGTLRAGLRIGCSLTTGALRHSFAPHASVIDYRWLRNGKPIRGATHARYRLKARDRHKRIALRITARRSGYGTLKVTTPGRIVR